jgi:hypothetical protein
MTKAEIIRKIEALLQEDVNMDAKLLFTRIAGLLEPADKIESFASGDIGYVHIDENRQDEYLAWENSIKQEWLETIENIRKGLKDNRKKG